MSAPARDLASLTSADFTPHVGGSFALRGDVHGGQAAGGTSPDPTASVAVALELVEVVAAGSQAPGRPRRAFSVVFRGPRRPFLRQGIYRLEHALMGTLDIFLVPITPDPQGPLYEAVFN